ncbi:MAG: CoA-binding protein [Anaerolineales bacterium]|nr:CoA-binding protein [Anaerolineales bacterium]
MTSKQAVQDFIAKRKLAIVGLSRNGNKFGNTIHNELKGKGYTLYPVHPQADKIDGTKCYPSFADLPEAVDGVIICVPPVQTEKVVRDAAQAGIGRVWMQQGAESPAAVQFCAENGISEVHGECVMMFAEPVVFPHSLHRWIWKLIGKLPK